MPEDDDNPTPEPERNDPNGGARPRHVRVFSFACFPAERTLILAAVLAGPAILAGAIYRYHSVVSAAYETPSLTVAIEPGSRLVPGIGALLALALVVFGVLYLQLRAGTRLVVDDAGFRYTRQPTLPFGLLARSIDRPWSDVTAAELRMRLTLSGRRPEVVIDWSDGRLVLSVADSWDQAAGRRPWLPRRPDDPTGWRAHPLVRAVVERTASRAKPSPKAI